MNDLSLEPSVAPAPETLEETAARLDAEPQPETLEQTAARLDGEKQAHRDFLRKTVGDALGASKAPEQAQAGQRFAPVNNTLQRLSLGDTALLGGMDDAAADAKLAEATGVDESVIAARRDEIRATYLAGKFDPDAYDRDHPEISGLLRAKPWLGPTVVKDEVLHGIKAAFRGISAGVIEQITAGAKAQGIAAKAVREGGEQPEAEAEIAALGEDVADATFDATLPKPVTLVEDEKAQELRAAEGPLRIPKLWRAEYDASRAGSKISALGLEIALSEQLGRDTLGMERELADMRAASAQRDVGAGPYEQMVLDSAQFAGSQVDQVQGAGIGGAALAVGAAGLALATGGTGAAALAAAGGAAGTGMKLGSTVATFRMEAGDAYLTAREMKTADGKRVDPDVALGFALLYGAGASWIETASFGATARAAGPLGEAVAKGGKGRLKAALLALNDAKSVALFRRTAAAYAQSAGTESAEEFSQTWAKGLSTWGATQAQEVREKGLAGAALQPLDGAGIQAEAVDSASAAGVGMLFGMPGMAAVSVGANRGATRVLRAFGLDGGGTPGAGDLRLSLERDVGAGMVAHDAAAEGAQKVEALQALKGSPTVAADPGAVAEVLADAPVALYVDPAALNRFLQDEQIDPADLLGADGAVRITEALAAGGKVEVSLREYLERWISHPRAAEMVPHTVTVPGHDTPATIEARARAEDARSKSPAEAKFAKTIAGQLAATGVYSPERAKVATRLAKETLQNMARRANLHEDELFERYNLSVEGEGGRAKARAKPGRRPPAAPAEAPAEGRPAAPAGGLGGLVAEVRAKKEARTARLAEEVAAGPKPSTWAKEGGGNVVVSEDASKPGRWRATILDAEGQPTGHVEAADHAGALAAAAEAGAQFGQSAAAPAPATPRSSAATKVITPARPAGEPARYAVIEAADLVPSHDPWTFQRNAAYPAGVQEREYHKALEEQTKVAMGGQNLNADLLLSDSPTAVDGPPLVTSGARALVMGGNGRSMMLLRGLHDPATAGTYRGALEAKAAHFGLDPATLATMKDPVLVRVLDEVPDTATPAELVAAVRRTNEGMTQALSPKARAVAEAKNLSADTFSALAEILAGNPDASLRELMRDRGPLFLEILRRDGIVTAQNQAAWVAGGLLTDEAKDRLEGMFLGKVVGSGDRMSATAPAVLAKLERLAPALLKVAGINPDADEIHLVQEALDLLNDARARGISLGDLVGQGNLFEESKIDPAVARMAELLGEGKPRNLALRFRAWAAEAAQDPRQGSLLGNDTPEESRAKLLADTITVREDGKLVILHQPAYHGGPHRFAKFSLEKIGTGEGAQVYGWGLYFTQTRGIAEDYRKKLSGGASVRYVGAAPESRGMKVAVSAADYIFKRDTSASVEDVIRSAEKMIVSGLDTNRREAEFARAKLEGPHAASEAERLQQNVDMAERLVASYEDGLVAVSALRPSDLKADPGGQVYEVDVPDSDTLLDYDKPLTEQPEKVKAALARMPLVARPAGDGRWTLGLRVEDRTNTPHSAQVNGAGTYETEEEALAKGPASPGVTGRSIYEALSRAVGSPKDASEALKNEGIPGLRYLDGNSRGAGEGTYNFVIWDDSQIVTERTFYQGEESAHPEASLAVEKLLDERKAANRDTEPRVRAQEIGIDRLTGALTRKSWDSMPVPPGKVVIALTSPDAKRINDDMRVGGHDTTNRFLLHATVALRDRERLTRDGPNLLFLADAATAEGDAQRAIARLQEKIGAGVDWHVAIGDRLAVALGRMDRQVDDARAAGTIPQRTQPSAILDLDAIAALENLPKLQMVAPQALADRLGALSVEDYAAEAFFKDTGVLTDTGRSVVPRKAFTIAFDLKGVRDSNIKYGKNEGNKLFAKFEEVLAAIGASFFNGTHRSGDEYSGEGDRLDNLEAFAAAVARALDGATVEMIELSDELDSKGERIPTGKMVNVPVGFRHGIGTDYADADRDLNRRRHGTTNPQDRARLEARDGGLGSGEGAWTVGQGSAPQAHPRAGRVGEGAPEGGVARIPQTETPEFREWFGDSKVVDAEGKPLVVYHGTPRADHSEFRSTKFEGVAGYFAADPAVASIAAPPDTATRRAQDGSGAIYPVYLSIRNPIDLSKIDGEKPISPEEFAAALPFAVPESVIAEYREHLKRKGYRPDAPVWSLLSSDRFRSLMREHGYDGVIYNEQSPAALNEILEPGETPVTSSLSYIAFRPTQIKSATGNRGTFDPNDPNILHQSPVPGPAWYSAAARAVTAAKQDKNSPAAWLALISKTPGVRKEEIDFLGLADWLGKQKGSISREQVAEFINAHALVIEQVEPGAQVAEELRASVEGAFHDLTPVSSEKAGTAAFRAYQHAEAALKAFQAGGRGLEAAQEADKAIDEAAAAVEEARPPDTLHQEIEDWLAEGHNAYRAGQDARTGQWHPINNRGELDPSAGFATKEEALAAATAKGRNASSSGYRLDAGQVNAMELKDRGRPDLAERHLAAVRRKQTPEELAAFAEAVKIGDFMGALRAAEERGSATSYHGYSLGGSTAGTYKEILFRAPGTPADDFESDHFGESGRGLLAHARIDERLVDGAPAFFVQEMQSDLHQQAREEGYESPESTARRLAADAAHDRAVAAGREFRRVYLSLGMSEAQGDSLGMDLSHPGARRASFTEEWEVLNPVVDEMQAAFAARREIGDPKRAVPNAPLKTTWDEMIAKAMIRLAVEGGFTQIAWATGQQNIDVYPGLETMLSELRYQKHEDGTYRLTGIRKGADGVVDLGSFEESKLAGVVGKDTAKRIVAGDGRPPGASADSLGRLGGDDLKSGGFGMLYSYDTRVPGIMRDLLKKFGGKVTKGKTTAEHKTIVERARRERQDARQDEASALPDTPEGRTRRAAIEAEFNADFEGSADSATVEVWKADLPQALIDTVLREGMPLFQPDAPDNFSQKDTPKRGPRGSLIHKGRDLRIILGKSADPSTFIHEFGHAALEIFSDLAADPKTPDSFKADFSTLMEWSGFGTAEKMQEMLAEAAALNATLAREDRKPTKAEARRLHDLVAPHEKFARGFERYLMEGKAPAARLHGIFSSIKKWMLGVYRSALSLRVEFTPEVRGVFDRLLASDEEIEAAQQAMGLEPLFRSPEEMKGTAEEFAAYLAAQEKATTAAAQAADRRILADGARRIQKWWKDAFDKTRAIAEEEYETLPARQAQLALEGKAALSTGEFVDIGAKIPPEMVAESFGFASVDEMADAIATLQPKASWATDTAEARMDVDYPDLLNDRAALRRVAAEGLHSEQTDKWLLAEWAALNARARPGAEKGAGQKALESIKAEAEAAVGRASLKSLRREASLAQRRERSSANKAATEAAKKNYPAAAVFKLQQLLNAALFSAYTKAAEEALGLGKLVRLLANDKRRKRLGLADPALLDGVDQIIEALGLREPGEQGRKSLDDAVTAIEATGTPVTFDVDVITGLLAAPRPADALTVAEMREVRGALAGMRRASIVATTAIRNGKRSDKQVAIFLLDAEAAQNRPDVVPLPSSESARTFAGKVGRSLSSLDGSLRKAGEMLLQLAGQDVHGAWYEFIFKPLAEAKYREADLIKKTLEPIVAAFNKMPDAVRDSFMAKVDGAALFPTHKVKSGQDLPPPTHLFEILMMALNAGNESNLKRLTEGRNITVDQVVAAIDKHLTPAHMEWVQSVWDAAEGLWPEVAALEQRTTGLAPPKIPLRQLVTRHGTLPGGYFPAMYDSAVETVGSKQEAKSVAELLDPSFTLPGTSHSHTKRRVQEFSGALSLEPNNIPTHLAKVVHDIAYREALQSVGGLILNPKVQRILKDRLGVEKAKQFLLWLKDVGQMRSMDGALHTSEGTRLIRAMKSNTVVAILGYSVQTALGDFSNIFAAVPGSKLDAGFWAKGLGEYATAPLKTDAWAHKQSGELRSRRGALQREFAGQVKEITARRLFRVPGLRWFEDHAFSFMEMSDRATTVPIWTGAYRQALAAGEAHGDAVTFADAQIHHLFPSHTALDQAAWVRDRGFIGTSLMFYGFFSVAYNVAASKIDVILGKEASGWDKAKASGALLAYLMAIGPVAELLSGRGPPPPEEDEEAEDRAARLAGWTLEKIALTGMAALPFGGDVARGLEARLKGQTGNPRAMGLASVILDLVDALMDVPDDSKTYEQRIAALLRAAGPIHGKPIGQIVKTAHSAAKAVERTEEDEPPFEDPFDATAKLTYGERKNQQQSIPSMISDAIQ